MLDRAVRRAEQRRRAHGGGFRIAVAREEWRVEWARRAPFLDPCTLRHAAGGQNEAVPDARARLGLAADARVALVFGSDHGYKDLDTIWEAFSLLPEWTLLVVGTAATSHVAWAARTGAPEAVTRPGYVDDLERRVAFSAADLVVLSFRPAFPGDSAVLGDAVGFGVPVVCAGDCRPAAEVVSLGIGEACPGGDAEALASAIRRFPRAIDDAHLARARRHVSAAEVARRHLDALDGLGGQTGRK